MVSRRSLSSRGPQLGRQGDDAWCRGVETGDWMRYPGSLRRCDEVSLMCHRALSSRALSTMNIVLAYLQASDTEALQN